MLFALIFVPKEGYINCAKKLRRPSRCRSQASLSCKDISGILRSSLLDFNTSLLRLSHILGMLFCCVAFGRKGTERNLVLHLEAYVWLIALSIYTRARAYTSAFTSYSRSSSSLTPLLQSSPVWRLCLRLPRFAAVCSSKLHRDACTAVAVHRGKTP